MAYIRTGRPRGRPSVLGRPMTPAERMRRYRWGKAKGRALSGHRSKAYEGLSEL
jgi:hypothetical protein